MITDPIHRDLKGILAKLLEPHKDLPLYVAGSGLFTVERLAAKIGYQEIHSSDFNLPSCLIAKKLLGEESQIKTSDKRYTALDEFFQDIDSQIASSLLFTDMASYMGFKSIHDEVMIKEYIKNFYKLHKKLLPSIKSYYDGVHISSFQAVDPLSFIKKVPENAMLVFPPTSAVFYGATNTKLNEVVKWDAPARVRLNKNSMKEIIAQMETKREWILATTWEIDDRKPCSIVAQSRSSPLVKVYQSSGRNFLINKRIKIAPTGLKLLSGEMKGELGFKRINPEQLDYLRSMYLAPTIMPAPADVCFAVMVGEELIGAIAFSMPNSGRTWGGIDVYDAYMIADFCIRPSIYRRLSKLILVAALSKELLVILQECHIRKIYKIGTSVFTEHDESMKYRDLFDQAGERSTGAKLYVANPGRWTLKEGFEWWKAKHGQKKQGN